MDTLSGILVTGIGATLVMDLWCLARGPLLGQPFPNYALVGRWVAHMRHGQFRHTAIARADAVRGEAFIGWRFVAATGCASPRCCRHWHSALPPPPRRSC